MLLNKSEIKYLLLFLVVTITALFPFFDAQLFSIDDYNLYFNGLTSPGEINFSIENGRWFGAIMSKLFSLFIGDYGFSGILISYILICFQFTFCAYLISKEFKLNIENWYIPIVVSLGFIHGFSAEILTFKIGVKNIGSSLIYIISFYSWYNMKRLDSRFLFAVLGITLSLAIYQVILNSLLVITIMGAIYDITSWEKEERLTLKKIRENPYLIKALGIVVSTITYITLNKVIIHNMGLQASSRSSFIALADLHSRISQILSLFKNVLFDSNSFLIPQPVKLIFLAALVIATVLVIVKNINRVESIFNKTLLAITIISLLIVGLISICLTGLFLESWWMVPRMFTGIGLFTMFIFLILFQFNKSAIFQYILIGSLIITALSHININHTIAIEQAYLNKLDRSKARGILSEIVKIDGFENKRLYIHQRDDCWINGYNLKTNIGDMNLSAFCASWSKYKLLEFVGGYKIITTNNNDNRFIDSIYNNFLNKPRWPNKNSIWTNDSLIAVFP